MQKASEFKVFKLKNIPSNAIECFLNFKTTFNSSKQFAEKITLENSFFLEKKVSNFENVYGGF